MTSRAICVAVLAALPAAGCGTVANLAHTRPEDGGRVPFGGVKRDLAALHQPDATRAHHRPEAEVYPRQSLAVLCALDLPFSLIGDVLTWPYTAVYSVVNEPVPVPPVVLAPAAPAGPPAPPAAKPLPMPAPAPPTRPTKPADPPDSEKLRATPDAPPKLPTLPGAFPPTSKQP